MNRTLPRAASAALALLTAATAPALADPPPETTVARFRTQEIETGLTVGYAVRLTDMNADGKTDVLVIDSKRVVWYENPSWKQHTLLQGQTKPDNVCVAPFDVDRDGRPDLVLGADWTVNTREGGTLQWLKRPADPDGEWKLYPIAEEPTVHRVHTADLYGDGTPELILAPLHGRDSTRKGNWMDGRPVRILSFTPPKDPEKGPWEPEVISESLHVVHNVWPIPATNRRGGADVLAASYEGVSLIRRNGDVWETVRIGAGNQENPKSNRGASEIKLGRLADGTPYIATIEPWHGHQVVVYTPPKGEANPWSGKQLWDRHVLDADLKWGHAVWCADLDGDKGDELIIGVRDDLSQKPGQRRGIRIYRPVDAASGEWARQLVDPGGVAVEDAAAADLDGDGDADIVAVGRQTHNARIYWNEKK